MPEKNNTSNQQHNSFLPTQLREHWGREEKVERLQDLKVGQGCCQHVFWTMYSWTLSSCGCLHKISTSHHGDRCSQWPMPRWGYLAIEGCWSRDCQFSPRKWSLVDGQCYSRWSFTYKLWTALIGFYEFLKRRKWSWEGDVTGGDVEGGVGVDMTLMPCINAQNSKE